LSWKPFLFLGKISYSMYLWHYLIAQYLSVLIIKQWGISLATMNLSILVTLFILVPVSWISFKLFEAPYFRKSTKAKEMAYVEVF
jgi:peptidoglycan/LPS O-acetylase OafA/YrhL